MIENHARLSGDVIGDILAGSPSDVSVWARGEQGQERLHDGVVPIESGLARARERWRRDLKGSLKVRRVLTRDAVAVSGEAHGFGERHGRFVGHVLLARGAQPAGRCEADGRVRLAGIVNRGLNEYLANRSAEVGGVDRAFCPGI